MKIKVAPPTYYMETVPPNDFIPFDGNTDLERYVNADTGEELFYSANGDCYYNAKGEKVKGFFKKVGKGIVKGVKAVGRAIKKAARWVATKSKNLVKGAKKGKKAKGKALKHTKTAKDGGKDVFRQELPPAAPTTPPEQVVTIEGKKYSTEGAPAEKPVVVATDPQTGLKSVAIEYLPTEVAGVVAPDGTYNYYPAANTEIDEPKKMSTALKVGLVVGGIILAGVIVYIIVKRRK